MKSRPKKRKQKGGDIYDDLPEYIKSTTMAPDDVSYYDTTIPYFKKKMRTNATMRNIVLKEESNASEDTLEEKYNKLISEQNFNFFLSKAEVDKLRQTNTLQYNVVEFSRSTGMIDYITYYRLRTKQDNELDKLKKDLKAIKERINDLYGPKFSKMNGPEIFQLRRKPNSDPEKKEYLHKKEEITQLGLFAEQSRIAAEISRIETFISKFISKLRPIMAY